VTSTWIDTLLGGPLPPEGGTLLRQGRTLRMSGGLLRDLAIADAGQAQTRDAFAFKWSRRETYQSEAMRTAIGSWLSERYGDLIAKLGDNGGRPALVLDAGCGAGNAASLLFAPRWQDMRYVGVDISTAVDIARETITAAAPESAFLQADLMALPFDDGLFDIVISEGVLHHTPSTRDAIRATARLVRPGGLYAIYVYAKKSPVREFTDDHIRTLVSGLDGQTAWDRLMPLTKLGKALGELDIEIDVPDDIDVLGIPHGKINLQRLFYWHVCKAFYRPDLTLDEMNHINFDWFTPVYSHRQTPEEVRTWCEEAGLVIETLRKEEAGITVVARRPAG
jgi:SAM-dependent methyltransferase